MFSLNILSDTILKPIISSSFKTNRCFKIVIILFCKTCSLWKLQKIEAKRIKIVVCLLLL